jgi:Poly(ADP-ribose) polymerase and DNA-Ligase Zn-finger region
MPKGMTDCTLPPMAHMIEVAKSGRSQCRGCRQKIAKDVLRFGEETPNMFSEDGGMTYRWWHLECASKGKLANEVRDALKGFAGEVPEREKLEATIKEHLHAEYPYAERAANGRAKCRVCEETIAKGELRVAFERVVETAMGMQRGPGYLHSTCTLGYKDAQELGKDKLIALLREHSMISDADKDTLAADVEKSADKAVPAEGEEEGEETEEEDEDA